MITTIRNVWLLVIFGGCSLVVEQETNQCDVDADCERFEGHPTCSNHLCVASGLGPPSCFFGEPTTQDEFANRCTTSQFFSFDNCARLGACTASDLDAVMARTTTPVSQGAIPPPITNQPTPTVNCADLGGVIYITGSTNLAPLIRAVQPLLSAGSPSYKAVFAPQTSCRGAGAILDMDATKHVIKNTANNYAFYYDDAGNQSFCLLPNPDGAIVDVGESDIQASLCGFSNAVPNTADYTGPILTISMVVPSTSKQTAISAEAAHLVFGAGGDSRATPWTDAKYYFTRSSGTGTVQLVSRAIGIDPTMWWGIDRLSAPNLVASMQSINPAVAENVIGVLSADFADKARANLRQLAFQQKGQKYGYLPDSSPQVSDKANVRDGHYPIWGAIHFYANTTAGVPSQAASALISQFNVPRLKQELVKAIIEAGFVPQCAMKVSRTVEVGPLTAFTPPFGCGCYFDSVVTGTSSCKTCTGASDCGGATPSCNYGFCEKQ